MNCILTCIQALRGLAAHFVVFQHVRFLNLWSLSVWTSFFCISGFMIMFTTAKKVPNISSAKRLVRILPLYYLMTLGNLSVAVVVSFHVPTDQTRIFPILSKSLLFIPFWYRQRSDPAFGTDRLDHQLWNAVLSAGFSLPFTSAWNTAVWSAAHFWWFWWEWYRYLLRRSHPGSLR